jgi:hypothetical protein
MSGSPETASAHDTYEGVLRTIQTLAASDDADERRISWLTEPEVLGVARSPEGRVEIFLVGSEIHPRAARTRDNLIHQEWHRSQGRFPILANRILLPPAGHFEQVAAFLCIELIRSGAATDMRVAFHHSEPVIELALERLRLADEDLVGLCGELVLLQALLRAAPSTAKQAIVQGWQGHQRSSRDFELHGTGIEVKATTGAASSHLMQGLHQVEAGHSSDGGPEHAFYLASIGLQWMPASRVDLGASFTLPGLADDIVMDMKDAGVEHDVQDWFIEAMKDYGTDAGLGYDHTEPDSRRVYERPFNVTFARLYDMTDPNVQVLRADDVRRHPFTESDSLRFRINLPDQVTGDLNPTKGLDAMSKRIMGP